VNAVALSATFFWNVLMVAITIHWADKDFVLHEALLSFQQMKGSHTGERLADAG